MPTARLRIVAVDRAIVPTGGVTSHHVTSLQGRRGRKGKHASRRHRRHRYRWGVVGALIQLFRHGLQTAVGGSTATIMPPSKLTLGGLKSSRPRETGYQLVGGNDQDDGGAEASPHPRLPAPFPPPTPGRVQFAPGSPKQLMSRKRNNRTFLAVFIACCIVCGILAMAGMLPGGAGIGSSPPPPPGSPLGEGDSCPCRGDGTKGNVPDYFQTKPEFWPGPTQTGSPAFLAQTAAFSPTGTASFVPNQPLQTAIPIEGMKAGNKSVFDMMGFLSPYQPSPGFGVDEHPLPPGADIIQVQMLSRHGSRYPTSGANVVSFGQKMAGASDIKAKGDLSFLNEWSYGLGLEILVPKGRQELFDSGILHSYMYSALYNPNSKIIVRTTTQDRMLKSAEYWLTGFFGIEWPKNATLEVIIDAPGFNNSLAGYMACSNGETGVAKGGKNASEIWIQKYLKDATTRINDLIEGIDLTADDVYAMQTMCPYETVAYGFSLFCNLFTYDEWVGFGYSTDLYFAGNHGFQSPVGRATGLGYQQEVIARLKNHTLGYSGSNINVTLDNNEATFPLNQSLYFDFSHDTNIFSILTAFGLRQFAPLLPAGEYPGHHDLTVSHITPFGARLDIEIIKAPHPVKKDRTGYVRDGGETKYVHFVLNQRTLPLGRSLPECDSERLDGWCELDKFLEAQEKMEALAKFDQACFGDYAAVEYGKVTDGAPL
ncbi:histidine acid phosphatase [Zalerion maritima]|uniref:3-phytase n=1 Tax=Zalerion maritima TaxID=339359 RepID=A0AAD5RFL8_9PEZI|nr:histidine acid phosphatase [Zalerion maritima]